MKERLYIGNYSLKGINVVDFDEAAGIEKLSQIGGEFQINSYVYKYKDCIYSVVENRNDEILGKGYVEAYKVKDGNLYFINQKLSDGEGPVFITVDEIREILYVCNYTDASFIAFKINEDGSVGEKLFFKRYSTISRIHQLQFSKDMKKLYVADMGESKIYEFQIKYKNGVLELVEKSTIVFPDNSKPRHIAVDNNFVYVVTEVSCEVYKLGYNENQELQIMDKRPIFDKEVEKDDTRMRYKSG